MGILLDVNICLLLTVDLDPGCLALLYSFLSCPFQSCALGQEDECPRVMAVWVHDYLGPLASLQRALLLLLLLSRFSCVWLCHPIVGCPPGSSVPGTLQARSLEWVAISSSSARKWKVKVKSLSGVRLLATPWTAAHQAPPSMGFSRQECWSGAPLPSPPKSLR